MKEEFITLETAKLAKEKGFDEKVYREYDKSGYLRCTSKSADVVLGPYDELLKSTEYPAPTQSLLQRWLRERYKIDIIILPKLKDLGKFYGGYIDNDIDMIHKSIGSNFLTYEHALEKALINALNQIK